MPERASILVISSCGNVSLTVMVPRDIVATVGREAEVAHRTTGGVGWEPERERYWE